MWEIIRKNKFKSVIAFIVTVFWFICVYSCIGVFFSLLFDPTYSLIKVVCMLGAIIVRPLYFIILLSSDWVDDEIFIIPTQSDMLYLSDIINEGEDVFFDLFKIWIWIVLFIFIFNFLQKYENFYRINTVKTVKTDKNSNKQLYNIVEEISIASGLQYIPSIYILDTDIPNAYACGLIKEKSSIVISKGILKILTRDELQCVIAHEISHIINKDTNFLLCSGMIYNTSSAITSFFTKRKKSERDFFALFECLSYPGQIVCHILFKFMSKNREYIADACASVYTRNPVALASALEKIEKNQYEINNLEILTNDLIKASFIIPVNKDYSMHPSTENRIKILKNMVSADYLEYENQFQKIIHKKLIPDSALKNSQKLEIKQLQEKILPIETAIACSLNSVVSNKEQIAVIKENRNLIEQNIKKNRDVENFMYHLSKYTFISCECGTKLKIPPVYKHKIIICPHCNKKYPIA